jgi:protein O-GlcNAc transferase
VTAGDPSTSHDQDLELTIERGVQHHNAGRLAEAERIYQDVLRIDPRQPTALHLLGVIAHQAGNNDVAIGLIGEALLIDPDYADAHNNLGNAFQVLGRLGEAMDSYGKALAIKPDYAEAHFNLGNTFLRQNRLEDAAHSYRMAIAINPDNGDAYVRLGVALQDMNALEEAADSYRKALEFKPENIEACYNLGVTLQDLGRLDDAVDRYRATLVLNPDYAEAHYNLGVIRQRQNMLDEAADSYRKAIGIRPGYAEAHNNLGVTLQELVRLDEAIRSYRDALAIKPDYAEAHSNLIFCLNYSPGYSSTDMLEETRCFNDMVAARAKIYTQHTNDRDPIRRLKVGLVSGDLRQHPVGYFLSNVLCGIDANKLELFAYAISNKNDDVTIRLKKDIPNWRNVANLDDDALVSNILADQIDILIDLSGHTANNRLNVFASKPAPVQVTWLGYVATTGIDAIDYVLCDKWSLPQEDEGHFVEQPWRLPNSYLCFSPPDIQIDVGPLPALANSYVTFGCFNNLTKISDQVVPCWADILHGVPDSRLFLKAKQLCETSVQGDVISQFEKRGISSDRLVLQGPSDRVDYLKCYNQVDITLDPFPFGGVTTSSEALWMGTPILAAQGDRFVSRAGGSILQNIGLGDWIAESPEDYVEKGIAFASDLPMLSALRSGLRQRFVKSPVCDAPKFAQNLETAFRGMWKKWCDTPSSSQRKTNPS